jgi:hypothetical protein
MKKTSGLKKLDNLTGGLQIFLELGSLSNSYILDPHQKDIYPLSRLPFTGSNLVESRTDQEYVSD